VTAPSVDPKPPSGSRPCSPPRFHPQIPTISLDEYLELVDATGRLIVSGKRGTIPSQLAPILERLQIDVDRWLDVMLHDGAFLGTAVGKRLSLTAEAARRGIKWIADKTRIHCERRSPVPTGCPHACHLLRASATATYRVAASRGDRMG